MGKLTIKGKSEQGKIDKAELIRLATSVKPDGQCYTQAEMANEFGVSRGAVTKMMKTIPKTMLVKSGVENYREHRADIFAEMQKTILSYITPTKLKQTSIQQLSNLFKMFYEKEKLELGQATEHIAVIHKNVLDEATLDKIEEAIAMATEKKLIESRKESLRLATGGHSNDEND